MNIYSLTKSKIKKIKKLVKGETVCCNCFIIAPTNEIHESGYNEITVILCYNDKALKKLTGKDVIILEDIKESKCLNWKIDCLSKNGYFRIWYENQKFYVRKDNHESFTITDFIQF